MKNNRIQAYLNSVNEPVNFAAIRRGKKNSYQADNIGNGWQDFNHENKRKLDLNDLLEPATLETLTSLIQDESDEA